MRLAVKILGVACFLAIPAACTLAFPLDYLQDGEGGSGPTTSNGPTTTSTMAQTTTTGQGGAGGGGGGSPPATYSEAVLADGPVLYFRMNQATDEPNLGSLAQAGDGAHSMPHAVSPSVLASDVDEAATYDDPATDVNMVGELDTANLGVPALPTFFGPNQALTFEIWLRLPAAFGVETADIVSAVGGAGSLRLRLEANAMNAVRFGFSDAVSTLTDYESVCYFVGWTGTAARHFVAVYDPTQIHRLAIYMDGARCDDLPVPDGDQTTGPYAMPAIDGAIRIGTGWSGDVDEFALYPTVLSEAQICAHYEMGSGLACP